MYYYVKEKAKEVTNSGKKSVRLKKEATVSSKEDHDAVHEGMARSVADRDFGGWSSRGSSSGGGAGGGKQRRAKELPQIEIDPEVLAKKEWIKAALKIKNEVGKEIEAGKTLMVKMSSDEQNHLSAKFMKDFEKMVGRLEMQHTNLVRKSAQAEGSSSSLFVKGKNYGDPTIDVSPLLESWKTDFNAVANKLFK